MHDIKFIRDNPEQFDAGLARRGLAAQSATILAMDETWRRLQRELEELLAARNAGSANIAVLKKSNQPTDDAMAQLQSLKTKIPELEVAAAAQKTKLDEMLAALPNLPEDAVPAGKDEHDNVEIRRQGEARKFSSPPKPHDQLGEDLAMMDFTTAANVAGARFVFLRQDLARLERALAQFMIDTHFTEFGYEETSPPLLVRSNTVYGTGQLPKFADDLFKTTDDRWLIPTAEVPLTAQIMGRVYQADELPKRYVALTPCFRSEAGAAGKDTKGMIRQHQFWKVELVSITTAEQSNDELERMTACAEHILQKLQLPYRTMLLCSGDMGFAAKKTYDIEVFVPAQNCYREISSCSNVGDFQARRLHGRYKDKDGTMKFVHTLNGSGLAVGRALVAVMENYQSSDGGVDVPAVLQPYMAGMAKIIKK
ncbi:MAG: serine--tRNA ligase [Hydrotalea sp.]|nr:serine--tRNA ligase [Hydrotalea sp.]